MPNTIFPLVQLTAFENVSAKLIMAEYCSFSVIKSSDLVPVYVALQRIGFDAKHLRFLPFLLSLFPPQTVVIPASALQGLLVKSAILESRPSLTVGPTFTEQANFCDIMLGHYTLTWPTVYFESWSHFHIDFYISYSALTSLYWPTYLCVCVTPHTDRNHSLAELPYAHTTCIHSAHV
jgi:hypothetical protein